MELKIEDKQRIVNRVCFPVSKVKVGENQYRIVNDDTGRLLSEVSERYTLVKNGDLFIPFAEKFGYDKLCYMRGYGSGKYYIAKFFTGREFNFGTHEKPDIVKEQIVIQNSYNKTKSFSFMFGAFRMVCSNGLYTGEAVINYKKIHVGEIPIKEMVTEVFAQYEKNHFESWQRLAKIPLTLESQIKLLEDFKAVNEKDEKSLEACRVNRYIRYTAKWYLNKPESVDNQRTAWGLLNQINRGIAQNMASVSKISQNINANKRAEQYLIKVFSN